MLSYGASNSKNEEKSRSDRSGDQCQPDETAPIQQGKPRLPDWSGDELRPVGERGKSCANEAMGLRPVRVIHTDRSDGQCNIAKVATKARPVGGIGPADRTERKSRVPRFQARF